MRNSPLSDMDTFPSTNVVLQFGSSEYELILNFVPSTVISRYLVMILNGTFSFLDTSK